MTKADDRISILQSRIRVLRRVAYANVMAPGPRMGAEDRLDAYRNEDIATYEAEIRRLEEGR